MEVTGRPTKEDIAAIKSPFAATMLENLPPSKPKPLAEMFSSASAEGLDMLRMCLKFNPDKRITAEQSLRHPYVAKFHNTEDEPASQKPVELKVDDNKKYSASSYRERLYKEVKRKKVAHRRRNKHQGK